MQPPNFRVQYVFGQGNTFFQPIRIVKILSLSLTFGKCIMRNIDTYAWLLPCLVYLSPIMHSPSCITYYMYPHGQFNTQVPNNYFNYCKVILQLQQYFNHYSTPMNNINEKFGIITVVCCFCYIHPSS